MILHVECIYGFYHGQDPRTFTPDPESCTEKELQSHRDACTAADNGIWQRDDSGCSHTIGGDGSLANIMRGEGRLESAKNRVAEEWTALYTNGIVPQRPPQYVFEMAEQERKEEEASRA